ncbi:MAG: hypothetical protein AAGA12_05455 [Pseudomonadota bacterium]
MNVVTKIHLNEAVMLDPDRLVELCVEMGQEKAEALIRMSLEHIKTGLDAIDTAFEEQDFNRLKEEAEMLHEVAMMAGMTSFARVSLDVVHCAEVGRIVPLSATMNRLRRLGNMSLDAVWDLGDMMR